MNPIISIQNLSKDYTNRGETKNVLKNISFDIAPGQIIGYIGPNGAGKSTTIKILSGILGDFEGSVKISGHDVRSESLEIKRKIGYIPENAALYEVLTPMEYLAFIGGLHKMNDLEVQKKTEKLLDIFDLWASRNQRMNTFSKGMKQKVLIISGLLHNPEILFLDEPLSGLDANSVIMFKEVLKQLAAEGKTIFYSSHIMDVVEKISDRIILIDDGRVVADGSFAEISSGGGNSSLEDVFSKLTGKQDANSKAEQVINVFGN